MNSTFNFNAIKRPVVLLAVIPVLIIGLLTSLELERRLTQLKEAKRTELIIDFTQRVLEFSHHFSRELVAHLADKQDLSQWIARTDKSLFEIQSSYHDVLTEEEIKIFRIEEFFRDVNGLLELRKKNGNEFNKEKFLSVLMAPRNLVFNILSNKVSSSYQKNLFALNQFLKFKENVYLEGVVLMQTLREKQLSKANFEELANIAEKIEGFKVEFEGYASPAQYKLYQQQLTSPIYNEINQIHEMLFLRVSEFELLSEIGYVGFIHHFKNYVLRGEQKYYDRAVASYNTAVESLKELERFRVGQVQVNALKTVLQHYMKMLPKVRDMHRKGYSVKVIDQNVKIDDSVAEQGLQWLKNGIITLITLDRWHEIWEKKVRGLSEVKLKILEDIYIVASKNRKEALSSLYGFFSLLILSIIGISIISYRLYKGFKEKVFQDFNTISRARKDIEDKNEQLEKALEVQEGNSLILSQMMGASDVRNLAEIIIATVGKVIGSAAGIFYVVDNNKLVPVVSHGLADLNLVPVPIGAGFVGKSAVEKQISLFDFSESAKKTILIGTNIELESGVAVPLLYNGETVGVLEFALDRDLFDNEFKFLEIVASSVAVQLLAINDRDRVANLLGETKEQKTELEVQQRELQRANIDLEEKAHELYAQQTELEMLNSELEASKNELVRKAKELEDANSAKSMFLANVSHELRTPLNSILILSRILARARGKVLGDAEVKNAEVIHSAGEDLLKLIDDILDLAKIESGHMELKIDQVFTSSLIENINNLFTHIAEEKKIKWIIKVADDVPKAFLGDQLRIEQILKNLIANSFKFTDEGKVELEISINQGKMEFRVHDTGPGMDEAKASKIFAAFEQGDSRTERKFGGTGLGLSISKSLANSMSGDLLVEDTELEKGSTFLFVMPLEYRKKILIAGLDKNIATQIETKFNSVLCETTIRNNLVCEKGEFDSIVIGESEFSKLPGIKEGGAQIILVLDDSKNWLAKDMLAFNEQVDAAILWSPGAVDRIFEEATTFRVSKIQAPKVQSDDFGASYENKSVLIVDDDYRNIFALKQVLDQVGLTVYTATNGLGAIEFLKENAVDLVFMDSMMPVMDGLSAIRVIRNELMLSNLPIISLTAKAMSKDKEQCLNAGASDYLSKPLDIDIVLQALSKWLGE